MPNEWREQRAISTQMSHSSYKDTRHSYQRAVQLYGVKHNMLFPLRPKPAVLIPKY